MNKTEENKKLIQEFKKYLRQTSNKTVYIRKVQNDFRLYAYLDISSFVFKYKNIKYIIYGENDECALYFYKIEEE